MTGLRLSTTLVLLAMASLVVGLSFVLAGEAARKPVTELEATSTRGGIHSCRLVPGTTCGPVPDPAWVTTGARIATEAAGVLLVTAAGLWLRNRIAEAERPR